MANVLATYPKTSSGRAAALGALDKLGKGAEALIETDDALIAQVNDYDGDGKAARAHFAGANVRHTDIGAPKAPRAGQDGGDFQPTVEIDGQIVQVPASSREPQAPPEIDADAASAPQDEGAPDTADAPSPHLSGAAQSQARRDKAKAQGKV